MAQPIEQVFSPPRSFLLQGRWVPGTMDRVCLSRGEQESLEVGLLVLVQMFGQEAINALYLQGKAELFCNPQLWALLAAASVQAM